MIDLAEEQQRIKDLIEAKGLSVVEIEKRATEQSGIYLKSTGIKVKNIWNIFFWNIEIIEPSLAKHNSVLNTVSAILTALQEDRARLSQNQIADIDKASSVNIKNGFKFTINFTSTKRI